MPEAQPERSRKEQELYVDPQNRVFFSSELPPPSLYPRVVLRFADEKNLWISGMSSFFLSPSAVFSGPAAGFASKS